MGHQPFPGMTDKRLNKGEEADCSTPIPKEGEWPGAGQRPEFFTPTGSEGGR